jgi:hypothetical protein
MEINTMFIDKKKDLGKFRIGQRWFGVVFKVKHKFLIMPLK